MKIAAAQMACVLGDVQANLDKIRDFCVRAKQEGAELIVFPEAADTGYSMPVIRAAGEAMDGRGGAGASGNGERASL